MKTFGKTRCQLASLRAGARFSNPERAENAELNVEVEGEDQRVRYKKFESNQDDKPGYLFQPALSYEAFCEVISMLNWGTAGGTV